MRFEELHLEKSKLHCPFDKSAFNMFFSLVDYRNNYFTSNDPEKIIEFYDGFDNRDQLIQWMSERPKGVHTIYEVEGDNDIIVVIPTADYNGKYAKECRDNIFKGLHIIFVESKGDYYFNYAHNCNVGIKKAMEYTPKWIVVSNDDMYKIDDCSILVYELRNKDSKRVNAIFTPPSRYHSVPLCVGKARFTIVKDIARCFFWFLWDRINLDFHLTAAGIKRRFGVKWGSFPLRGLHTKLLDSESKCLILTSDFSILSGKWVAELSGNVFNEIYINGVEDWQLSVESCSNEKNYDFIDYKIGDLIGTTLGMNSARILRDIVNYVFFDKMMQEKFT